METLGVNRLQLWCGWLAAIEKDQGASFENRGSATAIRIGLLNLAQQNVVVQQFHAVAAE